jgi:hypothetical protein
MPLFFLCESGGAASRRSPPPYEQHYRGAALLTDEGATAGSGLADGGRAFRQCRVHRATAARPATRRRREPAID